MSRIARFVRGLLALVATTGLLVMVPAGLYVFVGRPWPSRFPDMERLRRDLEVGDVRPVVVVALAGIVWLAWLRLVAAVVLEAGAVVRGARVPTMRALGSSQRVAACLVAGIALLGSMAPGGTARADERHDPAPAPTTAPETTPPRDASVPPAVPATTWLVRRGDSFWSIAERTTGAGHRWREIIELNVGRQVAPGVWFERSTAVIHPGWVLAVPTAAGEEPSPESVGEEGPARPGGEHVVVVRRGDTLSAIAAEELGRSSAWPAIWEANRGRQFGGRTFSDPNLILPGWALVIPDGSPAATPSTPMTPTSPPASTLPPATTSSTEVAPHDEADREPSTELVVPDFPFLGGIVPPATPAEEGPPPTVVTPPTTPPASSVVSTVATPPVSLEPPIGPAAEPMLGPAAEPMLGPAAEPAGGTADVATEGPGLPVGLGAATLLAGGVVVALGARRRMRLRSVPVGARVVAGVEPVIRLEQAVRQLAVAERLDRLDRAWRVAHDAARRSAGVAGPVPVLVAALAGLGGEITVLLDRPVDEAPVGWSVAEPGRWTVGADVPTRAIEPPMSSLGFPSPALVQLGRRGDADVYVDLEALGVLSIDAPAAEREPLMRALAATLSLSPFAATAELVVEGLGAGDLPEPYEACGVLDLAGSPAASAVARLAPVGASVMRRSRPPSEPWGATIAVITTPPDAYATADRATADRATADRAAAVPPAGRHAGVAVVAAQVPDALWRLVRRPGGWYLDPLALDLVPLGLEREDVGAVRSLLAAADLPVTADEVVVSGRDRPVADGSWKFLVRVLGSVEVVAPSGAVVAFDRAKALELVAWLTFHRERATRSAARAAMWEMVVRDSTFANVVSDARRALHRHGLPPEGEEWLGRSNAEHIPLHPLVTSDLAILEASATRARASSDDVEAIALLSEALRLVRGVPFAGSGFVWPDAEGITSNATLLVVSVAAELAERHLRRGEIDGVFWATGVGLGVLPGHEDLIAIRMRAHADAGDRAGVRQEWDAYLRVLAADRWVPEPSDRLAGIHRDLLTPSLAGRGRED